MDCPVRTSGSPPRHKRGGEADRGRSATGVGIRAGQLAAHHGVAVGDAVAAARPGVEGQADQHPAGEDDPLDGGERRGTSRPALRDIAVDLPAISGAVSQLDARAEALSARGVDVDSLDFEASYGRTSMEYYDGFVFGFYAEGRPDLPPVAQGGRYDALTAVLGQGRSIPAVGGVLRPHLMLALKGGA